MKFDLFIKRKVRTVLQKKGVDKTEALSFFDTVQFPYAIDSDGNHYKTKEELENAESVRPETGAGYDNFFTRGSEIFEDSDRELFESDPDNSE